MKAQKLREELIKLALDHLKLRSVHTLSLRELAKKAGVSEAAPYRHFKSKESLLAAISQEGFRLKTEYMIAAESSTQDPEEQLHRLGLSYLKMGTRHPEHFKLMTIGPIRPDPQFHELYRQAKGSFFVLLRVIERCLEQKIISGGDPYHKAMHCWTTVHGFTTLFVNGNLQWLGVNDKNAKAAMRQLTQELFDGLKNPLREAASFKVKVDSAAAELLDSFKK
jgi:AcrR family transcriptional regulator